MRRVPRERQGVTLAESAIVLSVFLLLVLGMVDLAVGVFRSNMVSGAARQASRQACVHGLLATDSWGPATLGPLTGTDSHPLALALQPWLTGLDLSQLQITVEWPDLDETGNPAMNRDAG